MVLTPLHYSVAYLFHRAHYKLSFPALIVASVIPDSERVMSLVVGDWWRRGFVLHSFLGAVTIGFIGAVLFTVYLYPTVVSYIFKIDKKTIADKCRFSAGLVVSCLIGIVAHVLVDTLHHEFNPLLFPFSHSSFDALVLFGDWVQATSVLHVVFAALSLGVLFYELYRGTKGFWKRVLVE